MSSIAISIKKKLVLQKILHVIRLVMLFFFFIFLFNLEDYDESPQADLKVADQHTEQKVFNFDDIVIKDVRTANFIGISVTVFIFVVAVLLEYFLVRCPKCRAHLLHLYTPNFCVKCGLNFNDCENEK